MGYETYRLLELGVLFLGVNEVEGDVECPSEDEGEEEGEYGQVDIALCAKTGRPNSAHDLNINE